VPGWLGGPYCDPKKPLGDCDESQHCPVFSPYKSAQYNEAGPGGLPDFERDASAPGTPENPGSPNNADTQSTLTQVDADVDLNTCVNSCYQYGVTGGYITGPNGPVKSVSAAPASGEPAYPAFYVPPGSIDPNDKTPVYNLPGYPDGTIPSYTSVIQSYLSKQWPAKYDPSNPDPNQCALGGPN
jgi:hypothetical protein